MMPTMMMDGTVMKAGTTPLTAKDTWILSTGEGGTTTTGEGAAGEAWREPRPAQTEPGGRAAGDELWKPVATVRGTTAEDAVPGKVPKWRTTLSEEEEEEEKGIRAGTRLMTTLHPQNLPKSWSRWRNL